MSEHVTFLIQRLLDRVCLTCEKRTGNFFCFTMPVIGSWREITTTVWNVPPDFGCPVFTLLWNSLILNILLLIKCWYSMPSHVDKVFEHVTVGLHGAVIVLRGILTYVSSYGPFTSCVPHSVSTPFHMLWYIAAVDVACFSALNISCIFLVIFRSQTLFETQLIEARCRIIALHSFEISINELEFESVWMFINTHQLYPFQATADFNRQYWPICCWYLSEMHLYFHNKRSYFPRNILFSEQINKQDLLVLHFEKCARQLALYTQLPNCALTC